MNGEDAAPDVEVQKPVRFEKLKPLPPELPDTPALKLELLPEPLRGWVKDAAERISIPLAMVAAPLMVVVSSLIGRRLGILPKRRDPSFMAVSNLWGAVVASSGKLKSAAQGASMHFLQALIDAEKSRVEMEATKHAVELFRVKLDLQAEKDKQRSAKGRADKKLAQKIAELTVRVKHIEDDVPRARRFKTSDATVEKLGELFIQNPVGLLLDREELSGLVMSFDRPDRGSDRAFYLESWEGVGGDYNVDRIGRGELVVPPRALSVIGGFQPGTLEDVVTAAMETGRGADGFVQRLQVMVWPSSFPPFKNVDRAPDAEAEKAMTALFAKLANFAPRDVMDKSFQLQRGLLCARFDSRAQRIFDTWRLKLETRLRGGDRSIARTPAFESYVAKERSLMPSFALIFHVVGVLCGKLKPGRVGVECARLGVEWVEFLEAHAKRIYARELSLASVSAWKLAQKIVSGELQTGERVREIDRHHWKGLDSNAIRAALRVLVNCGWVQIQRSEGAGRPSETVVVNPAASGWARKNGWKE